MDEMLRAEIEEAKKSLTALKKLLPPGGLSAAAKERAIAEMDELISPEFEPYFLANTALHLLARCERCGRCCREERTVAVSIEDARRIARHLGISLKRFMKEYTRPHELGDSVGSARMMNKAPGEPCPFFDQALPGCRIHSVKPQVCTAAYYLSRMNLLLCEERKELSLFPDCPADRELRAAIDDLNRLMGEDAEAQRELDGIISDSDLLRLLLRLKGMEIYFGKEKSAPLARMLGLKGILQDREMKGAALWYFMACR